MLWSGSSPLTVVRDGMWGFLLFAGVAWLAIAWSVLRLEPADMARVAGPVILFGAVTEAIRTLAGTRTWWLNGGMALLFGATGVLLLRDQGSSWTTPAALIGWYLLVRGAADIAISMLSRETDRIWGLLLVVGLAETGLGFFSASSYARTPELVVMVLGGAALTRGVADLVASLRLREASLVARAGRILELTPERAVGVAGYSAGMTDFETGTPARGAGPRHRAVPRASAAAMSDLSASGQAASPAQISADHGPGGFAPDDVEEAYRQVGHGRPADAHFGQDPGQFGHDRPEPGSGGPAGSFHDEVLRTTADLDAMLALAGVTGAAVPGAAAQAAAHEHVEVPDTAEGAQSPAAEEVAGAADDESLPRQDPAAEAGSPGLDETSIIARSRLVD
jgi:uncharacterized membrane protein HdeD (DUF308 family)